MSNKTSSQESLPLSQETYNFLENLLGDPLPNFVNYEENKEVAVSTEAVLQEDNKDLAVVATEAFLRESTKVLCTSVPRFIGSDQQVQAPAVSSSLPATVNWPGFYMFSASFSAHEQSSKSNWCFSGVQNKLYVRMNKPCPINFSTNMVMPTDFRIRAMAMFSADGDMKLPVKRCVNHSLQEAADGVFEAEHLIRCNSINAIYEEDPATKRHSVLVPFENPPEGQSYSSYIFNFMCFTSCSGGPNRRPMKLVFTLERRNEVLGRQIFDLRICACPFRDMNPSAPKSSSSSISDISIESENSRGSSIERKRPIENSRESGKKKQRLIVEADDMECYEFLKEMKKNFVIYRALRAIRPEIADKITINYTTSGSSSED